MPYGGTIFSTVNADLVQTDVDGIIQGLTGPAGMTLSDVQDRLNLGLFDFGMAPYLQMLQMDLNYYLYNSMWGWEPWLQTVDRSINDGFYYHLYDQNTWQPWMQTIHNDLFSQMSLMPWLEMTNYDLNTYLYNPWNMQPWMETLTNAIYDGFYYHMYDQNLWQPWLQTIDNDLNSNLYDWVNGRPLLESVRDELSAVRAVLDDVHDAAQHALRTV